MKTCRACRNDFEPMRPMQRACSLLCAQAIAEAKRHKEERAETKRRLLAIKPRSQWMKEAQVEFNKYIRLRDEGLACICCGRYPNGAETGGDFDAGHYRSRGAAPHLRFDERNVHAQLKHCNRYAFDVAAYRAGLSARIGESAVEALEADNAPRKYDIPALRLIRDTYRAKTRALLAEHKEAA